MNRAAMIRAALAAASLIASQAQAGQDVPPPRAIRPIEPVFADAGRWRETPVVMQHWSSDRHVSVIAFDRAGACDRDWADEGDEFAAFDGEDVAPEWETMR